MKSLAQDTILTPAGPYLVDFPAICKHLNWDKSKLCGPVVCSLSTPAEKDCPYGHEKGCAAHKPMLNGKPFKMQEHLAKFTELGFSKKHNALAKEKAENRKPPGQAKKVNGVLVWPARHFA